MPAVSEHLILLTPRLPCTVCAELVSLGRIQPLSEGRYTLIPVCSGHILTSIVRDVFKATSVLDSDQHGAA